MEQDRKGVFGGEEEGGGVRSCPGAARTILRFHIISTRLSKQLRDDVVYASLDRVCTLNRFCFCKNNKRMIIGRYVPYEAV